MRVIVPVDQNTGVLDTVTPSEPVLVVAAMEYPCTGTSRASSIGTLVTEFLEKELIEKGLKGGLYSRVVLILAHDSLRMAAFLRRGGPNPRGLVGAHADVYGTGLFITNQSTIAPQMLNFKMNFMLVFIS